MINELSGICPHLIWCVVILVACPGPVGWGLGPAEGWQFSGLKFLWRKWKDVNLARLRFISPGTINCFSGYTVL